MNTRFSDYLFVSIYKDIELTNFHDLAYEDLFEDLDIARQYYTDIKDSKHRKIINNIYNLIMDSDVTIKSKSIQTKFRNRIYKMLNKGMIDISISLLD